MKRIVSLLLIVIMVFSPVTALAAGEGNIRHEVTGDVSEFLVGEEKSSPKMNENKTGATMGTDLYIFVDPDTASYITFVVTDEQGRPLKDAQIYIEYNGKSELFGTTDKDGKLSTYLFRDTEYGYTVKKSGYETVQGHFTATEETKTIRVVMREYFDLNIFVVDGDKGVQGVKVLLDGYGSYTDEDGKTTYVRTNGVYNVEVITDDGRRIVTQAVVNGDTDIVIDISMDDSIVPGGRYSDRFLVYDKAYDPEDYVLTKYLFAEEDVSDAKDAEAYLAANPNTIHIAAQPDRYQNGDGTDTDKKNADGTPLYSQRSLMPTGFVLRGWEKQGYEDVVFMNEEMGLRFPLASLHGETMMKLYAMIHSLTGGMQRKEIATDEVRKTWKGLEKAGLWSIQTWDLDVDKVDLSAIRDFEFEFAHDEEEHEDCEFLPESLYVNSLFEFRVTPILPETMEKMVRDGLRNWDTMPKDELMLASYGYFREELRRAVAAGKINEQEQDELYAWFVDGRLSKDEIREMQKNLQDGKLSRESVELLLRAAEDEKLYRVSCWLHFREISVNITELLPGLEIIRSAERMYEDEYQHQLSLLKEDEEADETELSRRSEAALEENWRFLTVDNLADCYIRRGYKPGQATDTLPVMLRRSLPYEDGDWYDILSKKLFEELTVDVRKGGMPYEHRTVEMFRAEISTEQAPLTLKRAFLAESSLSSLVGLTSDK